MSYTRQNFQDGQVLTAAQMNLIDTALAETDTLAESTASDLQALTDAAFRMGATPMLIPDGTDLSTLGVGDYYCPSKGSAASGGNPATGAMSITGSPVLGSYRLLVCKRTNNANYHTLIAWGNDGRLYVSQKTGTAAGQTLTWTSTVALADVASAAALNTVQGNVATLQADVGTLQTDMTAAEADIASLREKEYVIASGLTADDVTVGTVNVANNKSIRDLVYGGYLIQMEEQLEGTVLLKNDNGVLPLAKGANVTLFGGASGSPNYGAGGSGGIISDNAISWVEAFDGVHYEKENSAIKSAKVPGTPYCQTRW